MEGASAVPVTAREESAADAPGRDLTRVVAGVAAGLSACFTAPTFRTFAMVLAGLIAAPARRTVCGMLTAAGLAGVWHHSRAHGFFARARWCADQVGLALLGLIVNRLVPAGAPVLVAIDDTLFRRTGRKVYATAWCHDGSARGLTPRAKLR